jgi:hypothetical protein
VAAQAEFTVRSVFLRQRSRIHRLDGQRGNCYDEKNRHYEGGAFYGKSHIALLHLNKGKSKRDLINYTLI